VNADQRLEDVKASEIMRTDLTTIPSTMPLAEVERVLSEGNISGAPVVDQAGHITGVISLRDILWHNAQDPDGRRAPAPWSWGIEEPYGDADSSNGLEREPDLVNPQPLGIPAADVEANVEDTEFSDTPREEAELQRMVTGEAVPLETSDTAAAVMTADVRAVAADATLAEVAAVMTDHRIHRVLVRRADEFIGMVTSTDVLRAIAQRARRGRR